MRLGELIDKLEKMPPDAPVRFHAVSEDVRGLREWPGSFMSYRGYYDRLALDSEEHGDVCVADLLKDAKACVDATFHGYKGGEYRMDRHTFVHVADYGRTSDNRIVGVRRDANGNVQILVAHVEDF